MGHGDQTNNQRVPLEERFRMVGDYYVAGDVGFHKSNLANEELKHHLEGRLDIYHKIASLAVSLGPGPNVVKFQKNDYVVEGKTQDIEGKPYFVVDSISKYQ